MNLSDQISAVVLAAGESRRMGRMKMLLPLRGTTMLENVIENIRQAGIKKIIVVTGYGKEQLTLLLEKKGVNYCVNNNYSHGMLSSVICGIKNLTGESSYVMIFQGDQPLISPATIGKMASESSKSDKGILIPVYKGMRGHPLMVGRHMSDRIESLDPSIGLKALSLNYPDEILEVDVNDPGILKDFDTYEEYLKEINQTT